MLCMNIVLIMTTPLFGAQLKPIQMAHIANGKIVMKIAVKTLIKNKIKYNNFELYNIVIIVNLF